MKSLLVELEKLLTKKYMDTKKLENTRFLIGELTNVQDLYYSSLIDELDVKDGGEEWVFDYIYNARQEDEDFETYLERFDKKLEDILNG